MLESSAEGALDTASLSGALELHALWVGSAGSDGVRLNLSSIDLRRAPLVCQSGWIKAELYGFRDGSSLMLSREDTCRNADEN
jgi:hypothetical protein